MNSNYRRVSYFTIKLIVLLLLSSKSIFGREKINFNESWRFHYGEVEDAFLEDFNDSQWRVLDLPHDYSIELGFDEKHSSGWRGGFTEGGIGWYRKTFNYQPKNDQKTFILFDGIYMNGEVWINGKYLGKRPYGYISYYYDLSPFLKKGKNVLAVKVDNEKLPSGRWYTGSGIYRNVWLVNTSKTYIPIWGTYFKTNVLTKEKAENELQVIVKNDLPNKVSIKVETKVLDRENKTISSVSNILDLNGNQLDSIVQKLDIPNPQLWTPESPYTYIIETRIWNNKKEIDKYLTRVGLRTIEVNPDKGFLLNGKSVKLKGVCNHHDGGPVGAAVPEGLLYSRIKLLKEMGCNAIRTSHNPFAPEFYEMCDTLGIMVMDEAFDGWKEPKADYDYGHYFAEWWKTDLKDFLLRDRNHPSIVMWSIGNEVPDFTPEQQKIMVDFLHSYDKTRPITQARGFLGPYLDVAGFNGHGEEPGYILKFRKQHPNYPMVGTEMTHTLQTRGVYQSLTKYRKRDFRAPWEEKGTWEEYEHRVNKVPDLTESEVFDSISPFYQSSYDNAFVRMNVRDCETMTRSFDFFMGTFRWTGFDYLGEALREPARTSNFGIIDLAGFPKDHYYLYQSLWSDVPMVHLLPHWTHPGKEGLEIPVVVYTNAEKAELVLNGKSLGEKKMTGDLQIVWMVPYQPGKIEVVAKNGSEVVARNQYETANSPYSLNLEANKQIIISNKKDVALITATITDKNGITVPEGDALIKFSIEGPAKIIGVENGDIIDFSPVKGSEKRAFKSKCLLIIQSTGEMGNIVVKANAKGLKEGAIHIKAVNKDHEL